MRDRWCSSQVFLQRYAQTGVSICSAAGASPAPSAVSDRGPLNARNSQHVRTDFNVITFSSSFQGEWYQCAAWLIREIWGVIIQETVFVKAVIFQPLLKSAHVEAGESAFGTRDPNKRPELGFWNRRPDNLLFPWQPVSLEPDYITTHANQRQSVDDMLHVTCTVDKQF